MRISNSFLLNAEFFDDRWQCYQMPRTACVEHPVNIIRSFVDSTKKY